MPRITMWRRCYTETPTFRNQMRVKCKSNFAEEECQESQHSSVDCSLHSNEEIQGIKERILMNFQSSKTAKIKVGFSQGNFFLSIKCFCLTLIWVEGKGGQGGRLIPPTLLIFLEYFRNSKSCSPGILYHSEPFYQRHSCQIWYL